MLLTHYIRSQSVLWQGNVLILWWFCISLQFMPASFPQWPLYIILATSFREISIQDWRCVLVLTLIKLAVLNTFLCTHWPILKGVFDVGIWAHNLLSSLLSSIFIGLGWTWVGFLKKKQKQKNKKKNSSDTEVGKNYRGSRRSVSSGTESAVEKRSCNRWRQIDPVLTFKPLVR